VVGVNGVSRAKESATVLLENVIASMYGAQNGVKSLLMSAIRNTLAQLTRSVSIIALHSTTNVGACHRSSQSFLLNRTRIP
jgi:hypothetical protein